MVLGDFKSSSNESHKVPASSRMGVRGRRRSSGLSAWEGEDRTRVTAFANLSQGRGISALSQTGRKEKTVRDNVRKISAYHIKNLSSGAM